MTTNDMVTLRALLEKSSDSDLFREMIEFAAGRLMALEVEGLTGAAHGERTPERINQRNGYRDRLWDHFPIRAITLDTAKNSQILPNVGYARKRAICLLFFFLSSQQGQPPWSMRLSVALPGVRS